MQPEPALTYKKIGSGSGAALKLPVYFLLINLSFKKKMLIYIGNNNVDGITWRVALAEIKLTILLMTRQRKRANPEM